MGPISMTEGCGPLSDIKVLELAGIGPTPFAGMMLQQLGASVTRIEKPEGLASVIPTDRDPVNRDKTSRVVDLKDKKQVERLVAHLAGVDVLIEGYRPGVIERLGLGPEVLLARCPNLIIGRMTGWGQDGPLAHRAGHDLNYIGLTGALHAIGAKDGPPQIPLNLVGDYGGGALYLVVGILAALHDVRRGGSGQVVDAAIVDGAAHLLGGVHGAMALGQWSDRRGENFMDGGYPFYAVYETADGEYMTVTAVEAPFYAEFIKLLGISESPGEQMNRDRWPTLREKIAQAFLTRTQEDWDSVFADSDACVSPVLSLRQAAAHPHIVARQSITMINGSPKARAAPRFLRPAPNSQEGL